MSGKSERLVIAFLTSGIEDPFSMELEKGIMQRAEEDDVNAVIVPGKFIDRDAPEEIKYEYQYNSLFTMITENTVDAIIVAADCIGTFADREHIHEFLLRFKEIPCVLVASKDGNLSNITYDNCRGIEDAVKYLVEIKGCKKFAMLGGPESNTDATERRWSFENKLREYGIELEDRQFVEADLSRFVQDEAKVLLDNNPDAEAIFCANDDMAVALYEVLKERNIIPGKDIYVWGYDNTVEAGRIRPSLSSVWADPVEMAREAFDMAMNLIKGRKTPNRKLDTVFVQRDSFGTEEDFLYFPDMETDTVKAAYNKIFYRLQGERGKEYKAFKKIINDGIEIINCTEYKPENHEKLLNDFRTAFDSGMLEYADIEVLIDVIEELFEMISVGEKIRTDRNEVHYVYASIYKIIIKAQDHLTHSIVRRNADVDYSMKLVAQEIMSFSNGNDRNYAGLLKPLPLLGVHNACLFLLNEPVVRLESDEWVMPEEIFLKAVLSDDKVTSIPKLMQKMRSEKIFSNHYIADKRHNMIILPMFANEMLYGYLICDMSEPLFANGEQLVNEMSAAVKMLHLLRANEHIKTQLEHSLNALKKNNIELDTMSKQDVLTGLYNRRGFYEAGSEYYEKKAEKDLTVMFMYVDMDNLKIVNDRFGHDDGDFALKSISEALKSIIGNEGVIARIGGDEFAVVTAMDISPEAFKERIRSIFDDFNDKSDKPYRVSASVGICCVDPGERKSVEEALALADDDLYIEKKSKSKMVLK